MRQPVATDSADHYVQRLDLGADPFVEGFRSDYFYGGGQRRQVLDQVLHFSQFSDQVVLLVGSTGGGTSTLLDRLLDQLESVMDFCTVDAESVAHPESILATLSSQLQFDSIDSATSFLAALRYNADMESDSRPLLVAVDQAHFLSIESLDLLHQLYQLSGGALHLLLVGEYQLEQLSKLAGFNSSQLKLIEIEPLSAAETGEYVLGLLQSVGYAGEQPLTTDQVAILYEQSGGNIAEINLLAPSLLSAESKVHARGLNLSIPMTHLAAIVILLVAIGLSYWYRGADVTSLEPYSDAVVEGVPSQAAGTDDTAASITATANDSKLTGSTLGAGNVTDNAAVVDLVAANSLLAEETSAHMEKFKVVDVPPVAAENVEHKVAASAAGAAKNAADGGAQKPNSLSASDSAIARSDVKPAVAAGQHLERKSQELAVAKASLPASTPTEIVANVHPVAKQVIPPGERRLLNLGDSAFMLQLMGSVDEARARALVKAYTDRLPITYFESRRQSRPWYVVVTGPYESKEAAYAGIRVLPGNLQRQQPWVRSVASVKQDIHSNRD